MPRLERPLVYACSGASDTGEISDRAARWLNQAGIAEMSCLAGIGGRVKCILAKAEQAHTILVVDGCPLLCAKRTIELAGFKNFLHLGLHQLGFRKGACPATEERIAEAAVAAAKLILSRQNPEPAALI
ncbi:MAG: putative zinc-binding protein [Chloroflexi bacterium]|nr:putative zinc-binding protein [Chloroflexota bacterium]